MNKMLELRSIGGYNEIGKNCTAIKVGNETFLFDLGIHLENYIQYTEDEKLVSANPEDLMGIGAVPDISALGEWKHHLKAILPSHAHLDHIGAIPYLASDLRAPIVSSPFTIEVIKTILHDEEIRLRNHIKAVQMNGMIKLSNDVRAEFIHVTHSTPHSTIVALHTKEGIILYANDFKLDYTPTLGPRPNTKRLEELGRKGVKALIADSTNAAIPTKTPSEAVARQMLEDVLLGVNNKGKALIVTTFSSHIARLKSIIEMGKRLGRKVVFLGRSLHKYSHAAERCGIVHFSREVHMAKYKKQIKKELKNIMQKKGKYLVVATGHQGEPGSTLSRMASGELKFKFDPEDHVIFSCRTIPTPTNMRNRERLEEELKAKHARLFLDIHTSGHAAREDLRDLLHLVKPQHLIPSHGSVEMRRAFAALGEEMGYKTGKNIHLIGDGGSLRL
jgi:ribonuclease J